MNNNSTPPERLSATLLRRTPDGGWSREHPQTELTELEQQALAWDASCERARQAAASIERAIGEHADLQNIQIDGDRILVSLHITDQSRWAEWRRYFGIRHDQERPLPYMVGGQGFRDGVRVSVLAYHLPQARALAQEVAREPFEFEGIVYDLARPQQDAKGDVWFYQGERTADGMPLLSLDGRPERCTLANIARLSGPLTPVTGTPSPQTTPVMTGGTSITDLRAAVRELGALPVPVGSDRLTRTFTPTQALREGGDA
ncbi:BN159_2729 family protein [Streptomyces sp. NPDC006458]|uniref:BN159_2729 family protein n=1 Tax=Streptomyces sp. NPDC006458 TaxID=3154302 RepID=UPI0033A55C75